MKLNLTPRRLGAGVATMSLAAAAVTGTGLTMSANADDPKPFGTGITDLVLGVGINEQARTVAWYSDTKPTAGEVVELATKADFSDKTSVAATVAANTAGATAKFNGKATLSGLKAATTYYYRVAETGSSTNVSTAYSFKTGEFGNSDFQFLFFGDPQIGAGKPSTSTVGASLDAQGWAATMANTATYSPQAELYVSGGDQINDANNEDQWNDFLAPGQLRSIPWAATIGNHDVGGLGYEQHFALPDTVNRADDLYADKVNKATTSGGDYWFTYKGVLFIDLNSNAYTPVATPGVGADPAHVAFVKDTIQNHKGDAQHVVLVYHHSIYSAAEHTNDGQNLAHRRDFTKTFSDLGVDLVLQGHDHSYSRSYALKSTAEGSEPSKADPNEQPGQGTVVETVGGVVYVTANSASGSKFYGLGASTSSDLTGLMKNDTLVGGPQAYNGSGVVKTRLAANSVENQEYVPTYIQVTVNEKGLQVKNIRAGDDTTPNSGKLASGKGGVNGAGVYAPIGSIADQFDLFRTKADISPILPPKSVVTKTVEVPGPTVEVTKTVEVPGPTVEVTKTVEVPGPQVEVTTNVPTPTVNEAKARALVDSKIAQLTKQIKKAKGAKKKTLKVQLNAYKAVKAQLR